MLKGHMDSINSVAFSPNSRRLALAFYKIVQLWDITTEMLQQTLKGHTDWVNSVAFSPSGSVLNSWLSWLPELDV
jgi:WD40 repeat protein